MAIILFFSISIKIIENIPEILGIIDTNTFSKLSAQQQLNDYKEV